MSLGKTAVALLACFCMASPSGVGVHVQESADLGTIVRQLQSPETTDRAAEHLLKLGKSDTEARRYLAAHLPEIIEKGPIDREPWISAVRLAGILKLVEAAPALAKWINAYTGDGIVGLSQAARLEDKSAAKALAQIGNPVVPLLADLLSRGDPSTRWETVFVLNRISSASAKRALRDHLKHETDQDLREFIEKSLARK